MTAPVSIRLDEEDLAWLRSQGDSLTEVLKRVIAEARRRSALAAIEASYRVLPMDEEEDEWGNVGEFMDAIRQSRQP